MASVSAMGRKCVVGMPFVLWVLSSQSITMPGVASSWQATQSDVACGGSAEGPQAASDSKKKDTTL